jgi:hypothetical protein
MNASLGGVSPIARLRRLDVALDGLRVLDGDLVDAVGEHEVRHRRRC